MVAGAEECDAGAGEDLEEEKGDNTTMINDDDRQHTTINRIRWRHEEDGDVGGDGDRNGKWVKEEKERTTIEGRRRRRGDGGCG